MIFFFVSKYNYLYIFYIFRSSWIYFSLQFQLRQDVVSREEGAVLLAEDVCGIGR